MKPGDFVIIAKVSHVVRDELGKPVRYEFERGSFHADEQAPQSDKGGGEREAKDG